MDKHQNIGRDKLYKHFTINQQKPVTVIDKSSQAVIKKRALDEFERRQEAKMLKDEIYG